MLAISLFLPTTFLYSFLFFSYSFFIFNFYQPHYENSLGVILFYLISLKKDKTPNTNLVYIILQQLVNVFLVIFVSFLFLFSYFSSTLFSFLFLPFHHVLLVPHPLNKFYYEKNLFCYFLFVQHFLPLPLICFYFSLQQI